MHQDLVCYSNTYENEKTMFLGLSNVSLKAFWADD